MKVQLELHGGLYGHLLLEPVETGDEKIAFPEDLLNFIETPGFQTYKEKDSKKIGVTDEKEATSQTEKEKYCLTVSYSTGKVRSYYFSKSMLGNDPDLKKLIDFIWSVAKPVHP